MIDNNIIKDNKLSGIVMGTYPMINNRISVIKNNTIEGNGYDSSLISGLHNLQNFANYPLNSGIEIWGGNASIENNTIVNNHGDGIWVTGDDIRGYFRPYIAGNNISANSEWGIEARYEAPINNKTINEDNTWTVDNAKGRFVQKWRIRVYVSLDNEPVSGATVWVEDITGTEVWRGTTNSNGYTHWITVIEYYIDNSGIKHTRTPHTIYANYGDYYGTTQIYVDRNMPFVEIRIRL